jgi:hypothetical protein
MIGIDEMREEYEGANESAPTFTEDIDGFKIRIWAVRLANDSWRSSAAIRGIENRGLSQAVGAFLSPNKEQAVADAREAAIEEIRKFLK